MNRTSFRPGTPVPLLLALLASSAVTLPARAADPAPGAGSTREPAGLRSAIFASHDEVLFDEPGDGALWTRGRSFKAAFDGRGATVIPFFGSQAPHNYPLELFVSGVTLGGQPLPLSTNERAVREGKRVSIPHVSFTEQYDVELDSLEQRFVFDTLPRSGDLVLRMSAAGELAGSDLGTSLRFENQLGRVDYGEAFAVDAAGRKIALDSTLVDGTIQLVVPAGFLATATLPLTIDPFITFFTVSSAATYEKEPDVSYDVTSDRWCVSWSTIYSATDYDAYVRLVSGGGGTLFSTLTIDFTGETWTDPHIANNNAYNVFLVVASVVPASGISEIRGRLITPATASVGTVIQISPLDGAYRNSPDVGGDTYPVVGLSNFCVVWQRSVNFNNNDIEYRIVNPNGTAGGLGIINNSIEHDTWPSISNSMECATGGNPAWTVVWERRVTTNSHAIYGAQLDYDGYVLHPTFEIDPGHPDYDSSNPTVSTILDQQFAPGERPYLVTFERNYGDKDIIAVAMRGTTKLSTRNLSVDYGPAYYSNQTLPSVDSDGSHFFVGWTETNGLGTDLNVWVSDYYLSGTSILPCLVHGNFAGSPTAEGTLVVSSRASGGGPRETYFGTWEYASGSNLNDIQGGLWNGCTAGGVATGYCAGDGSGSACPCGNAGFAGRGCASSGNPLGGYLLGVGGSSVALDTFHLFGQAMPASSPCLYFQGTSALASGVTFGDGLLCLGGTLTRLGVVFNDASGNSSFPASGTLSSLGGPAAGGGSRAYQIWYRDSAPFCTASTFNLTNGVDVTWSW
jgi:hypothetical protein